MFKSQKQKYFSRNIKIHHYSLYSVRVGMAKARLEEFYKEICNDLQRTVDFWLKYSHDEQYG